MNRMTRNEAAKYLGVSSQTISNLIKRNILFEIKDNVSRQVFVNAEDVVRYKSSYKVISAEEKMIDHLKKSLKDEMMELRKSLSEIRSIRKGNLCIVRDKFSSKILNAIFGEKQTKNQIALISFMDGVPVKELPYIGHLTPERIRGILGKEIKKAIPLIERSIKYTVEVRDLRSANNTLLCENAKLKDENSMLSKELSVLSPIAEEKYFLEAILKYKYSKQISCLAMDFKIDTFKKLTSFTRDDLKNKYRIPKGKIDIIEQFLKEYGYELNNNKI
nr:MAG TPA: Pyocin activator protein PrtN [Bacteriophage sp.]